MAGAFEIDDKAFVAGAQSAINRIRSAAERRIEAAGDEMTAQTKANWPLGPGRNGHTRDKITGSGHHTPEGFVYELDVPFPGPLREFGTRRQPPRPVLRPARAAAAAKLARG